MEKANFGKNLKETYEAARRSIELSTVDKIVDYILTRLKDYAENGREEALFDSHPGYPTAMLSDLDIKKQVASTLRAYGLKVKEEVSSLRIDIKGGE